MFKGIYINNFFLHKAELWNSLAIECFPLTYNLSGFKSRTNRHVLTVGALQKDFLHALIFVHLFQVTPCIVVSVQPSVVTKMGKKREVTRTSF